MSRCVYAYSELIAMEQCEGKYKVLNTNSNQSALSGSDSKYFICFYLCCGIRKNIQTFILTLCLLLVTWALDPWGFCWDFLHCDILVFGGVLLFSKDKSDTDLQS